VVRINSRKVLDGILQSIGIDPVSEADAKKRLVALRAIDKLDRLGPDGVSALLGKGRKDESGDYTEGAGLPASGIDKVLKFVTSGSGPASLRAVETVISDSAIGREGVAELIEIEALVGAAGYEPTRVCFDPSIVRGLEYYTGPVLEVELAHTITNEKGETVRFGSVGSGGRYDGLVERFTGQKVPATGFSVGVSRLQAALTALGQVDRSPSGPVVVTVMEKERVADYQRMVQELRAAGIRAELYLGNPKKFGKQLEYADRRGSPCVVIQGSDERANGEVTLKDLIEGAKAAEKIAGHEEWKDARPAQVSVKELDLVAEVKKIIARHRS
jgi:histidyl-tRNA synthetase